MEFVNAQLEASDVLTSRPSGATVALNWLPRPRLELVFVFGFVLLLVLPRLDGARPVAKGNEELLLETLDGVVGGTDDVSINVPLSARSTLLPTSMRVRFGDARARASFIKEGREANVE